MKRYPVDVESLRGGFPDNIQVPPLLEAFGRWLQDIPRSGLGYFDGLWGEPLDSTYVRLDEDPIATEIAAENLRKRLGIFLHLPDGSRLALWYHGAGPPAVVLLGSEDARENIASSLEAFLVALEGRTGVSDLDNPDDGDVSKRSELQAWLARQGVQPEALPEPPDFLEWFLHTVESAKNAG